MIEEHKKEEHHIEHTHEEKKHKEEHHEKKSSFNKFLEKIKKLDKWKKVSIALAVLLIVSIFTNGLKFNFASGNSIGNDVSDYLNNYLLAGQGVEAKVLDVSIESGLYNVKLDVGGREFNSYVTKDGKLLFPSSIDLTEKPALPTATTQPQEIPKTDKPDVSLYIMSYCPYGVQAVKAMAPVAKLIKDVVKVNYVIYANYQGGGPDYCVENGKYCSMHGVQEVNEDVRQMCIQKYQKDKFWDYILAVSDKCNSQNVDSCWENVAKSVNVDTAKVKSCFDKEKVTLLKEQYDLNQKNSVSGSPTVIINGADYSGQRTADGFKDAICSAYNTEPSSCSQELEVTGQATAPATGGCG